MAAGVVAAGAIPLGFGSPVAAACAASASAAPSVGDGSSATPYEISTAAHLLWLSDATNSAEWSKEFVQTDDIDMADCTWVPIAQTPLWNNGVAFTGVYDGGGFSIANLSITDPNNVGYVGMFGNVSEAEIRDLELAVVVSPSTNWSIGGLVGLIDNPGATTTISSVSVAVSLDSPASGNVGGLVGEISGSANITDVTLEGAVRGGDSVGGLLGNVYSPDPAAEAIRVADTHVTVAVVGEEFGVGGLVGSSTHEDLSISGSTVGIGSLVFSSVPRLQFGATGGLVGGVTASCSSGQPCRQSSTEIMNSTFSGDVVSNGSFVGGLVGAANFGATTVTISDSASIGSVSGRDSVGGLVGLADERLHSTVTYVPVVTVTDSLARGPVVATGSDAGCVVGNLANGTAAVAVITNSYSESTARDARGVVSCQHKPGAPTGVSASGDGGTAAVSWAAPTVAGEPALTTYTVTAAPGGATCTATAPAVTCDVTGLTVGTSYTFSVSASNTIGAGPTGASSTFAMVATPTTTTTSPATTTVAPATTVASGPSLLVLVDEDLPEAEVVAGAPEVDLGASASVVAGTPISVTGTGFTPDEEVVTFFASQRRIADKSTVDASGSVSAEVDTSIELLGEQMVVMWEPATDRLVAQKVLVESAVLPATGGGWSAVPLVLIGVGALGLLARRRTI